MIENRRCKTAGHVTDTAVLRSGNVPGMLAGRRNTMTRSTITRDTGVIEDCIGKTRSPMAYPAILGSGNMVGRFSNGPGPSISPVVARDTITGDSRVIENLWSECPGGMANVTILLCRHMIHGSVLTGSEPAIVTTFAASCNTLMSEIRWRKAVADDVTHVAIIRCRNMIG